MFLEVELYVQGYLSQLTRASLLGIAPDAEFWRERESMGKLRLPHQNPVPGAIPGKDA